MKKKIFCFIFVLIAGLLESTLLESVKLFGVKINLMLIMVALAGIVFELRWALFFGIFAGLVRDSLGSVHAFGINTFLFCLWILLIRRLSRIIPLDNNIIRVILVSVLVLCHNLALKLISVIFNQAYPSTGIFIYIAAIEVLYAAAISPAVFSLFESLIFPETIE